MTKLNKFNAIKALTKKHDIRIIQKSKKLIILSQGSRTKLNDLGGGSWGKIDFLTKQCGFTTLTVDKFIKPTYGQKHKKIQKRTNNKMYSGN